MPGEAGSERGRRSTRKYKEGTKYPADFQKDERREREKHKKPIPLHVYSKCHRANGRACAYGVRDKYERAMRDCVRATRFYSATTSLYNSARVIRKGTEEET